MSPRHQISPTPSSRMSASTASSACQLPWMSEMTAMRKGAPAGSYERDGSVSSVTYALNEMSERFSPALREVSDAVLAVASNLGVEQVLQRLVDVSRGLVHA